MATNFHYKVDAATYVSLRSCLDQSDEQINFEFNFLKLSYFPILNIYITVKFIILRGLTLNIYLNIF